MKKWWKKQFEAHLGAKNIHTGAQTKQTSERILGKLMRQSNLEPAQVEPTRSLF